MTVQFTKKSTGPAKKILVISPSGQVYNHNCVKWYNFPGERIVSEYFNIGDMVVYDSTLKILNFETVEPMKIVNPTEADIESYQDADFAIVRASNFIHNEMVWHRANEVLEKLQIPIYALGVGGQAASAADYTLNPENHRFWKIVSERSNLIGVRGCFTADLLYRNGIKNVEIVGCPSIFRTLNRDLKITPKQQIDNVAFSIRREVDSKYSANPELYREVQRNFLLAAAREFNLTITTHGEPEEKAFFYRDEMRIQEARTTFSHEKWFTVETAYEMERLYREKMFFFLQVEDYDNFIKTQDFAIGYRVHGVLPALANGTPGFLVKYDTRSAELADSLAIPSLVINEAPPGNVAELLRDVSFDEFNRIYPLRYDKMRFVLETNNIPHLM